MEGSMHMPRPLPPSILTSQHLTFKIMFFTSVSHTLEFDGVDFDEPMEVGLEEEEKATVKDEDKSKLAAEVATKVEPKAEARDPILV